VLAGLGAALGHLARQQRVVAGQQRAQAALFTQRAQQVEHQAPTFGDRVGGEQGAHQFLDAAHAPVQLVDLVDDVDRYAVLFQVRHHAVGGAPAGVEQRAQVAGLAQCVGLAAVLQRLAQRAGAAAELAEGLVLQRRGVHALAQGRAVAGGLHGAGQDGDGVEQRRARGAGAGVQQGGQAGEGGVVDGRYPGCVTSVEEQPEQVCQVARLGRARQQAFAQAAQGLAGQRLARAEAEVGEQRGGVDVAPEGLHLRGEDVAQGGLLVELVQQVAQAHHRQRRA